MHTHSFSEHRLLHLRGDTPRGGAELSDSIENFTNELQQLTEQLTKTYSDRALGADAREQIHDVVHETERSLDGIRGNLFEDIRKLVPSLGQYIRLGGDYPPSNAGLSWQSDTGRLSFDASAYANYTGGEYENGRGYSLDDPGNDATFSALLGTPGSVNLVSLFGPHSQDPLPYSENEEPFYVAPSGLYPSVLSMLSDNYGTEYRRVRADTSGGLDALRRSMPRPYGTPGRDGFPPAPPVEETEDDTNTPTSGTPGRDGFPPAPPRVEGTPPRTPRVRPTPVTRTEAAPSTARLEKEMAETRREYNAAREEVREVRAMPASSDRTARLTRLAERMEGMVTRIETLEQEIKRIRGQIS